MRSLLEVAVAESKSRSDSVFLLSTGLSIDNNENKLTGL